MPKEFREEGAGRKTSTVENNSFDSKNFITGSSVINSTEKHTDYYFLQETACKRQILQVKILNFGNFVKFWSKFQLKFQSKCQLKFRFPTPEAPHGQKTLHRDSEDAIEKQ